VHVDPHTVENFFTRGRKVRGLPWSSPVFCPSWSGQSGIVEGAVPARANARRIEPLLDHLRAGRKLILLEHHSVTVIRVEFIILS